jgi:phosphatidate cytidylyltransferase
MKRIITGAVLIAAALIVVFIPDQYQWVLGLVCALIAEMALFEYLRLSNKTGASVQYWLVMLVSAIFIFVSYWRPDYQMQTLSLVSLLLLVVSVFTAPLNQVLPDAAYGFFGLLYTVYPFTLLPIFRSQGNGRGLLIFLLVSVWAGDIFALYAGRMWGRHKLSVKLSPGKTWEGAVGSLVGTLICATLLLVLDLAVAQHFNYVLLGYMEGAWKWDLAIGWLLLALLLNIAAQVGDLAESALKRGAGVKDSGGILPGHGGVLDRIDGLLLAAPVLWCVESLRDYSVFSRFLSRF